MPPLVAIVGETGSGKSALAIKLAERFNGEIISADSRAVYKGMDIGTAKPTLTEREGIPHYGFDVVEPNEHFSAYDFQQLAQAAIRDIAGRGKLPIMAGGTGLYIDAVLYDYQFRPLPNPEVRAALQRLTVDELRGHVLAAGLPLPRNDRNPRHLMRLLENGAAPVQPQVLRPNTLLIGLKVERGTLQKQIAARVEAMITHGLVEEVQVMRQRYGDCEALRAPGYKALSAYLDGAISLEEAKRQFARNDLDLAKRQRTWFKRNKAIHWLDAQTALNQAEQLVADFLR